MILSKEEISKFEKAAKPLIQYLAENHHPHVTVIVACNGAEILESSANVKVEEFIRD